MGKTGCGSRIVYPKHSLGRRSWLFHHKSIREFGWRCAVRDTGFSKRRVAIHFSTVPEPNGADRDGAADRIHQILSAIARHARGNGPRIFRALALDFSVRVSRWDRLLAPKSFKREGKLLSEAFGA